MSAEKEYWYRMEDRSYSVANEWGEHDYSYSEVQLIKFEVIRHTPKGVWIKQIFTTRWVSKDAHKRFACDTIEGALVSFIARKNKQAAIYESKAKLAREMKEQAIRKYGNVPAQPMSLVK